MRLVCELVVPRLHNVLHVLGLLLRDVMLVRIGVALAVGVRLRGAHLAAGLEVLLVQLVARNHLDAPLKRDLCFDVVDGDALLHHAQLADDLLTDADHHKMSLVVMVFMLSVRLVIRCNLVASSLLARQICKVSMQLYRQD